MMNDDELQENVDPMNIDSDEEDDFQFVLDAENAFKKAKANLKKAMDDYEALVHNEDLRNFLLSKEVSAGPVILDKSKQHPELQRLRENPQALEQAYLDHQRSLRAQKNAWEWMRYRFHMFLVQVCQANSRLDPLKMGKENFPALEVTKTSFDRDYDGRYLDRAIEARAQYYYQINEKRLIKKFYDHPELTVDMMAGQLAKFVLGEARPIGTKIVPPKNGTLCVQPLLVNRMTSELLNQIEKKYAELASKNKLKITRPFG